MTNQCRAPPPPSPPPPLVSPCTPIPPCSFAPLHDDALCNSFLKHPCLLEPSNLNASPFPSIFCENELDVQLRPFRLTYADDNIFSVIWALLIPTALMAEKADGASAPAVSGKQPFHRAEFSSLCRGRSRCVQRRGGVHELQ